MIGIFIYTIALGILIYAGIEDIKSKTIHDIISILIFSFGMISLLLDIQPKISRGIISDMFLFDSFTSCFSGRMGNLIDKILGMLVIILPMIFLNLIASFIARKIFVISKINKGKSGSKVAVFSSDEKFGHLIGDGDILLCGALGFLVGYVPFIRVMIYGIISSGIFAIAGLLTGKLKKDDTIPLVPFIAFGFAIFLIEQIKI